MRFQRKLQAVEIVCKRCYYFYEVICIQNSPFWCTKCFNLIVLFCFLSGNWLTNKMSTIRNVKFPSANMFSVSNSFESKEREREWNDAKKGCTLPKKNQLLCISLYTRTQWIRNKIRFQLLNSILLFHRITIMTLKWRTKQRWALYTDATNVSCIMRSLEALETWAIERKVEYPSQ